MNIQGDIAVSLWLPALMLVILTLAMACYWAPWRAMLSVPARQHIAYAAILFLALFWLLNVEVRGLLVLHPLLITTLVMMFGWSFALLIGNAALLLSWFIEPHGITVLPVNSLLSVLVPATTTFLVLKFINRLNISNLFVYMLGGGFFGAMICVQVIGLSALTYFYLTGADSHLALLQEHYLLLVLLSFPEGFLNGMLVTMLTVLSPDLMKTFDDHRYLDD